jgi:Tfp pilus assembly protein PilN
VRPVNLLPQKHRPHSPSGGKSSSSYLVLGVLGLFLVAAVTYVMEANKITQAKSDIAAAEQKTAAAKARAEQLGPFANFAQVKEQRVASVRSLAEGRFDWERSVRELAHILPEGVWLRNVDASVTGEEGAGGSGGASAGGTAAAAGPSIKLNGCAYRQPQVAVLLVRLRGMEGVKDIKLSDSTRGNDPTDSSGSAAATGDSQSQMIDSCGTRGDRANYEFNATVEFDATQMTGPADPNAGKTPVRLGGGS